MLLAYFSETRAHRLIVDIFSIPDPLQDELFGDFTGETLRHCSIRTCGGSTDGIRELILNRQASEYCRWAACTALAFAVVAGLADRSEVVTFLASLLKEEEKVKDSHFFTGIVDTLIDLHSPEVMDDIRKAYAAGFIDETFADLEYIEDKAARDQDEVLADLRHEYERLTSENIHDYIRWWDEPGNQEAKRQANIANRARKEKDNRRKKKKIAKKSDVKTVEMGSLPVGVEGRPLMGANLFLLSTSKDNKLKNSKKQRNCNKIHRALLSFGKKYPPDVQ